MAMVKSHRFEPFSQRIAKLKIDPIHKIRRPSFGEEDADEAFSYFKSSLVHWSEINLAKFFSEFSRRVGPLSESLPQVLYHEEKIFALLMEYIGRRDHMSIEPLLSLLAQFARDLGARFEKHFGAGVSLVASIAATHPDVEVIEWSFTCLAWVFKFLSRLLVPDLRHVLAIMTPFLGKERQKPFITRFTAESMSFLIRKAGLLYYKNKTPLGRAVSFLFLDLQETAGSRDVEAYKRGLMGMFSDAIRGAKGGVYSNGPDILRCIIDSALADDVQNHLISDLLCGVVINLIHNTDAESFDALLNLILNYAETEPRNHNPYHAKLSCRLVFVNVVTRKGSRVKNWKRVHQILFTLLQRASNAIETYQSSIPLLLTTVAYALQVSPMNEMFPFVCPLMDIVSNDPFSPYFISFCALFSEFGCERFHSVVLPYFKRNLTSLCESQEVDLCLTLLQLNEAGCVTSQASKPGHIAYPVAWVARISERIRAPGSSAEEVAFLNACCKLSGAVSLFNKAPILPQVAQGLHNLLSFGLTDIASDKQVLRTFACGQGFKSYVDLAIQYNHPDPTLWDLIISAAPRYSRLPLFLESTLHYISASSESTTFDEPTIRPFVNALIDNLAGPSHESRLLSLKLLRQMLSPTYNDFASLISLAIEIEESALTLQTSRTLSMQVRKLALMYPQVTSHTWLSRLVPAFCFGLFSKKLAQLWEDSAEALKSISEHVPGEIVVAELAMQWLHGPEASLPHGARPDGSTNLSNVSSDFECYNVSLAENLLASHFQRRGDITALLIRDFELDHGFTSALPGSTRFHALRVLNVVPWIAEKRSRQIVPLFLHWASRDEDASNALVPSPKTSVTLSTDETPSTWGFKDRMSLLTLFSKFTNPKSLYRSSDVHQALLRLLVNGNSEVQKASLKALFAWKSAYIVPYQENLLNIVDESRFRDELTTFVHVGEGSIIEDRHKGDLLPILLRLLYGRMVSKAASHAGQGGQAERRKAILRMISHLSDPDFELFIGISFGPLGEFRLIENGKLKEQALGQGLMTLRRQSGLLKVIEIMFDILRGRMLYFSERAMNVVMYCLVRACRLLRNASNNDAMMTKDVPEPSQLPLLRDIRQLGIHCLDLIFSVSLDNDWRAYISIIFEEVINPRLENFAIETAQGISGLLRIFHTWASTPRSALYLTQYNANLVPGVLDCLRVDSARDEVKVFVINQILLPVIEHSTREKLQEYDDVNDVFVGQVRYHVLTPNIHHILLRLGSLLESNCSRPVLISGVETLSALAPCAESLNDASSLTRTVVHLLRQPQDRVPPKTKAGLLRIIQHFLPLCPPQKDLELMNNTFQTLASLFGYFTDNENRRVLATVFGVLAKHDSDLCEIAVLCSDLNAMSARKLDEVDYQCRLRAFNKINEELWSVLSAKQWRPLLFNMLFYMKDVEELAIRSSAAFGLKRFIERSVLDDENSDAGFSELIVEIVLPALQNGVRQRIEMIRVEFVFALGHLVQFNPTMSAVHDMHALLVGGDQEASFFNNILHIQQHRRLRSLRRLATEASKGKLQASNISSFFMPLVEHFAFNEAGDESAHNLIAEAAATIGVLAEWVEWNQFRAIFRRYRGYMQSKPELGRNIIRLLGRMTDALSRAVNHASSTDTIEMGTIEPSISVKSFLATTLPSPSKISAELTAQFIPFFTDFIHLKEESEVSSRLPVAVTAIKLLNLLPEEEMALRLPPVILDVCSILRSRAQESRDTARKTLADIAILLGPSYFGYILKELRTALARGYQLHVLHFTVHSILVATAGHFNTGDLDHCLSDLVALTIDDIFGATGQEKDAEDYVNKMKEVKSKKSYDSMELLAKNASIRRLGHLIRPLQKLLCEKLTSAIAKKVDELLRRIGVGLLRNPGAENHDLLVFCYEVIKELYQNSTTSGPRLEEAPVKQQFSVNFRGAKRSGENRTTSSYTYKLSRFALDLIRSALNKFHSLMNPANLAGFIPIIGDALVLGHDEVKISAIRLLSTIIKLPMPEIDENATVYLTEAVKMIKEAPDTNTEGAQASLKLISIMLRERKTTKLRDGHLSYLLKRLSTDIGEPDRQGIAFNFIRAVMERKFLVPEMYELVDNIAATMVTNQTRSARDLARGAYIYFLLEYPQAKSRWTKQLGFLSKNLDYQYREGRQAVMEAVHVLLSKTKGNLAQEIIGMFFLPVVMVMANDDTTECREMAGALLGELYRHADRERIQIILKPLRSWLEQTQNMHLLSIGLQAMRIFFEVDGTEKDKESRYLKQQLPHLMNTVIEDSDGENWQVLYFALQLSMKLCKNIPSTVLDENSAILWSRVRQSLFYPHAWVKTCAANLVGIWLADLAKTTAPGGYSSIPLVGQFGLRLDEGSMLELIRAGLHSLRTPDVSEELAMQSVRNVVFLARCCAENGLGFSRERHKALAEDMPTDESDTERRGDEITDGMSQSSIPVTTYIFRQASSILRREILTTKAKSLIPKTASIGLLAALCRHLDTQQIMPSLPAILLPLQHLTDPSIPAPRSSDKVFESAYESLVSNAHEVLELLQNKLGTTEYVAQVTQARETIKARREGRKIKRRIEAVTEPERYGREKQRKNERKREKRKEKGLEHRGKRRGW